MDLKEISLGELAQKVTGRLVGDGSIQIYGAAPLYEVRPGQITLLDDSRNLGDLADRASAVVVKGHISDSKLPQIVTDQPRSTFSAIIEFFLGSEFASESLPGISPQARVDPSAVVGLDCVIEAGATIGARVSIGKRVHIMSGVVVMQDTKIGDDCVVFPNVTLYPRTQIGDRVTIHAGTVLGAYGFGYRSGQNGHSRIPQLGYVAIEDDVEIGACVTIDRGTFGSTRIGTGTKIDNQVMIGHNCQIGKHNLLCSQVGIAGSCKTGDFVVLAGQVGLKDHITLGDHAVVGAQAGVMEDLPGDQVYLGSPATTQREQMQIMAIQRRLPELRRTIMQLERDRNSRPEERAA